MRFPKSELPQAGLLSNPDAGIGVQMQQAYTEYNEKAISSGRSRGHFMVDLCRPGHLTACLRNFQVAIQCREDNWDAQFGNFQLLAGLSSSKQQRCCGTLTTYCCTLLTQQP